jgi:hypothetical protein
MVVCVRKIAELKCVAACPLHARYLPRACFAKDTMIELWALYAWALYVWALYVWASEPREHFAETVTRFALLDGSHLWHCQWASSLLDTLCT